MFCRENRRPKGAKFKIYFSFEDCRGFRCGSLFGAVVVSTGCRWCRLSVACPPFCRVSCPFCPLYRFALGALPTNMALFRVLRAFLEGFPCWMWVCIACVLCVACGALYA